MDVAIREHERPFIGDQAFFSKPRLFFNRSPLSLGVQSVEESNYQQSNLYQHRWRIYGFVIGALVFGASFLLGMNCDERIVQCGLSIGHRKIDGSGCPGSAILDCWSARF